MQPFQRWLAEWRDRMTGPLAGRSPSENAFLFLLPVVGLAVGLVSVLMAHLITQLQNLFWGGSGNLLDVAGNNPWPLVIIVPLIGGILVGLIGWVFRVPTRGGGITAIMQAISLKGGFLSLRQSLPRGMAAVATLATGGSLGREGAMAMVASAVGSNLGRRFKLTPQQLRVLVCAAAAAALAAVYNAPIGGSLFALELLMGNFALEVFGPVVVASVISTLVFRSCMGDLPRFIVPRYELVSGWELVFYLGLGIVAGLGSRLFVRVIFRTQDVFEKVPLPAWAKLAIGLTLVGVIGFVLGTLMPLGMSRLLYWSTYGVSARSSFKLLRLSSRLVKLSTFSAIFSYCESATNTIPSTPRKTSWRVVL